MANNGLQIILEEQGVSKEDTLRLIKAFGAPFDEAGVILSDYKTIVVTEEDQFDLMAEARKKRLILQKVRTGVENKRKELKEDSLRTGRAIDSAAKFVKETIQPAEQYLEEQEKFGELRAAERKAKIKTERVENLSMYTDDLSVYNLDILTDEQFDSLVTNLKAQKEAKEAEAKKLEEERLAAIEAEKKRQLEIEAENKKLKAEADKRDQEHAAEQAKLKDEADKKLAIERANAETERKKREEIEAKQRNQEELEASKKAEAEEASRQALLAPDKEKLLNLATELEELNLPALSSKDAQDVLNQVEELLAKVTTYIRGNVKGL